MRKLVPLRITTFIGLSHFLIGTIGIGIVANAALYAIFKSGETALMREAQDQAYVIAAMLENDFPEGDLAQGPVDAATTEALRRTISVHLGRQAGVHLALYQRGGALLLTNAPESTGPFLPNPPPPEIATVQAAAPAPATGAAIRDDAGGVKRVYAAARIGGVNDSLLGATIQLGFPYLAGMAPTFRTMAVVAAVGVAVVFAILWVGWRSSIYLSEPVVSLSRVAERLSTGDLSARADPHGPLEAVHLAVTLNSMTARLHTTLQTMQSFVANASHELRTPLTGIKLQVGALRSGAIEEPQVAERFLAQIECEVDRLGVLVNDLLSLSQIESGEPVLMQAVDLADLAGEVVSFWEARATQAGLTVSAQTAGDLPPAWGDPYRLRRLMDNLVDNAIKNTPRGGTVRIGLSKARNARVLRLEVKDTGIGIAWDQQARIFERFYRIPAPRPVAAGQPGECAPVAGSGLGLAIAQSIAQAHGGAIGVISAPGEGATFWVELPAAAETPAADKGVV